MHRRAERALLLALLAVLVVVGGWAARPFLRTARWFLQGAWELTRLPAAPPTPHLAAPRHIAHAGGAFGAMRYTNALEALERNYARGVRWFEMDFLPDSQGEWWAVHDWREAHETLGIALDNEGRGVPRGQPPGAPYRVPSLDEVLGWIGAHDDTRLITDTKGENLDLLRRLGSAPAELRARIHPQIYRLGEYGPARAGGFAAPIFTTYRSAYPWWVLRQFVHRAPLLAVTVTRAEVPEAAVSLQGKVSLLTHTVNEPSEAADLMRAGFAGVYTDELLP
jgi:glycerophosphoryl diester phosphodiesterase